MLLANRSVETVCCSTRPVCEGMGWRQANYLQIRHPLQAKWLTERLLWTQKAFKLFFFLMSRYWGSKTCVALRYWFCEKLVPGILLNSGWNKAAWNRVDFYYKEVWLDELISLFHFNFGVMEMVFKMKNRSIFKCQAAYFRRGARGRS